MIDQQKEQLLPKANGSMYKLVRLAAERAIELSQGKKNLINASSSEKVTTIALKEIAKGVVVLKEVEELLETKELSETQEKTVENK